jgi:molybdopterin synthase catalytic subunit
MRLRLLFFATLRDKLGQKSLELEVGQAMKVGELKALLSQEYPVLKESLQSVLVSVNREFAFDDTPLSEGDEVAFFPPVSGGGDFPLIVRVTEETIDLNALLDAITLESTGAAAIFSGMVRGITERGQAHRTVYLEYEAYIPMAEAKMRQIAAEIRQRWPEVQGIAIVQRIGRLQPRTPTVLIACTAAHRDSGVFEAARYGIDRLKEIVPIWKKEVGPQGEYWVEGEYLPGPDDLSHPEAA